MFFKALCVFISLSLSAYVALATPTLPASCPLASVSIKTVTVTATAGAAAATVSVNNGSNSNLNVNNGNSTSSSPAKKGKGRKGRKGHKGVSGSGSSSNNGASTTVSSTTVSSTTTSSTTTSSAAAAASTTATATNNTLVTGDGGGASNNTTADIQKSLTLDPSVIAAGFLNDGQDVQTAGQVPSLTSGNNFINFCATVPNLPITNGKQITTGSCNPAPIGTIPSAENMPSSKFTFPQNFGTVKANSAFTISMAIKNMETGHFVNAQQNYFSAPQQLNAQGQIQGHSHVVVETIDSLTQSKPTDPKKFAFFKGLNAAAAGGVLTADVTAGLPVGTYRLFSINTAANHQPVIVPVAQHGSLDDAIYFTVTADGAAAANSSPTKGGTAVTSSAVAPATSASTSATANGNAKGGSSTSASPATTSAPAAASAAANGNTKSSSVTPATPAVTSTSASAANGNAKSSSVTSATSGTTSTSAAAKGNAQGSSTVATSSSTSPSPAKPKGKRSSRW